MERSMKAVFLQTIYETATYTMIKDWFEPGPINCSSIKYSGEKFCNTGTFCVVRA